MKLEAARLAAPGVVARMEAVAALCEAASDKFTKATLADVADPDILDVTDGGDARWIMLHAEHLLRFIDYV